MDKITVLIAEHRPDIIDAVKTILEFKGYTVVLAKTSAEVLTLVAKVIPQLIVLDINMPDNEGLAVIKQLKSNSTYQTIPLIALTEKDKLEHKVSLLESGADDFITKPFDLAEFVARVNTIVRRNYYNLDASPLTRLPGNQSIMRRIEEHLGKQDSFAVSYIDLNNFKAFNDKYGFSRGDDVIKKTAAIIMDVLRTHGEPEDFVGHIGGDDFIVISKPYKIDDICVRIIEKFDQAIRGFYAPEDLSRGGITIEDRQGRVETFPVMSVSIGTITNDSTRLTHIGQISALASELKKYAKSFQGSAYVKDRRAQELPKMKIAPHKPKESIDKIGLLNTIIQDRKIDILLQPIIDLSSDQIFAHEAFCRGPKGSPLEMPVELFRVARIMGSAWELDHVCIEKSLVMSSKLKEDVNFFLNIAPETWLNPRSRSKDLVASPHVKPRQVFFEVTMREIITDYAHYKDMHDFFRANGFGISVDDFGEAGIAALGYLADLKPDFIKLDTALIRQIDVDPIKQQTIGVLVDACTRLRIALIAEQVETSEEKEFLKHIGVKYAQGFFFAAPGPFAQDGGTPC